MLLTVSTDRTLPAHLATSVRFARRHRGLGETSGSVPPYGRYRDRTGVRRGTALSQEDFNQNVHTLHTILAETSHNSVLCQIQVKR